MLKLSVNSLRYIKCLTFNDNKSEWAVKIIGCYKLILMILSLLSSDTFIAMRFLGDISDKI